MKDETKCLHSGYKPKNSEPRVLPIVQSTTYVFDSTQDVADVFDDPTKALIYSRFANPTVMAVEEKIADLEGGIAAMCTSSGQAANMFAVMNICKAGDHILSVAQIYGGTYNLFNVTLKKLGIDCTFVSTDASDEEIEAKIQPNTKLVFGETIANPDIVTHSTTKYMDGHAVQGGGIIVDSGKFDWANGNFPDLTEPDDSYHGLRYVEKYGNLAYILKARMQLMRDFGAYPAAHSAFLLNLGLETLHLRMERYCENALAVAKYLEKNDLVESVSYPALESDKYHELYKKYLKGASGVISFVIKGGRDTAMKFMDSLELASNEVHVADIRTCVLHPASETHRQLSDEQLAEAGINPGMVRLSVGLESIDDILEDLQKGFDAIK